MSQRVDSKVVEALRRGQSVEAKECPKCKTLKLKSDFLTASRVKNCNECYMKRRTQATQRKMLFKSVEYSELALKDAKEYAEKAFS